MADVIAVIGAAGAAGREVLQVLAARGTGVERVRALETEVQRGDAIGRHLLHSCLPRAAAVDEPRINQPIRLRLDDLSDADAA